MDSPSRICFRMGFNIRDNRSTHKMSSIFFHRMPVPGPEILAQTTIRRAIDVVYRDIFTAYYVVRHYTLNDLHFCYTALTHGVQTPEMLYGANAVVTLAHIVCEATTGPCARNTPDAIDELCATLKAASACHPRCQAAADICSDVLHFLRQAKLFCALERVCRAVAVRDRSYWEFTNDTFALHLLDMNGNDEDDDAFDVDSKEFRPILRKTAESVKRGRGRPRKNASADDKELARAKRLHAVVFGDCAAPVGHV